MVFRWKSKNWYRATRLLRSRLNWLRVLIVGALEYLALIIPPFFAKDVEWRAGHGFSLAGQALALVLGLYVAEHIYEKRKGESGVDPDHMASTAFMQAYCDALTRAIEVVGQIPHCNERGLLKLKRRLLRAIVSVATRYHQGAKINANVMIRIDPDRIQPEQRDNLSFLDSGEDIADCECVLAITQWASDNHDIPNGFCMPVSRKKTRVLLGAPRAHVRREVQLIPNAQDEGYVRKTLTQHPKAVVDAVVNHLKEQQDRLGSFINLPLEREDENLAVLTVECDKPYALGENLAQTDNLRRYLKPLCEALGLVCGAYVLKTGLGGNLSLEA